MNNLINKFTTFFTKIKNNKKIQLFVILFLVIILIFCLFFDLKKGNKSSKNVINEQNYISDLENRLSGLLSKVEGAGEVSVLITASGGNETVLAMKTTTTETFNGVETVETPILVDGKTVVIKELYPNIQGVLIVAKGAKSISVMTRLEQATASLLNIDKEKIQILTMK